jgi:hypothetical protein
LISLQFCSFQMGAVAKLYMRKGFLIYEKMRKYLVIHEEAVSHIWLCNRSLLDFLVYEEIFVFFFIDAVIAGSPDALLFHSLHDLSVLPPVPLSVSVQHRLNAKKAFLNSLKFRLRHDSLRRYSTTSGSVTLQRLQLCCAVLASDYHYPGQWLTLSYLLYFTVLARTWPQAAPSYTVCYPGHWITWRRSLYSAILASY